MEEFKKAITPMSLEEFKKFLRSKGLSKSNWINKIKKNNPQTTEETPEEVNKTQE